jgi:hypothetical protein
MQFNQHENAYIVLQEALKQLATPSISRRCYILTDLTKVCIQKREIGEACLYANQALTLTVQAKSPALWERIQKVHEQLEPWKDQQSVKNFSEKLCLLSRTKDRKAVP